MKNKMKVIIRVAIVTVACAALAVGYFLYLDKRNTNSGKNEEKQITEAEIITTTNFDKNYPDSPRAVVKWYNRIATCLYNKNCEDDEIKKVALQERELLDDELLKANPEKEFLENINKEISDNQKKEKTIVKSEVCSSNDVKYATVNGYECAYVTTYYFGKEGNYYTRTYQKFCLRKDKEGKWKILIFEKVPEENADFS